jgi:UDP-N-acetylglucosamine 4,6-dehydratase
MNSIFKNKSILITGGTGTFGKAFITYVLPKFHDIKKIIVYSRDEFKQYEMSNLPLFKNNPKLRFFVGDVRDRDRLYRAFDEIDIVIHAAALKQIPSCEYNPFEAIKTNVYGAQNVIDAAIDKNVKKVVALSTDKACAPINLYGATKLCAEKLFIAGNNYVGHKKTRFSVVRYGNVAGSRGSIIPYFISLIDGGAKELPITDKRMTRFWLTIDKAINLVLTALHTMNGGELYVPKIPSVKIIDIAKAIAPQLLLKEIGMRTGEKIHEVLISKDDMRNTIEFPHYFIITPEISELFKINKKSDLSKGKKVKDGFEYNSASNNQWLSVKQIEKAINKLKPE